MSAFHSLRFLGASLGLTLDITRKAWRWQLDTATKLGAKRLIIVDHMDCGAFKEEFGPMSPDEERAKHHETLVTAAEFVRRFLPKLQVACYLQDAHRFEKVAV